jgi:DNA-binding response OmpR family regulator
MINGMRVLLIEDSLRLQKTVGDTLRRSGYAVDVSGDGEDGLWRAENNDYDVIVLDIMLPKLDGLALLKTLRKNGKKTHVLLLTAKDKVEDRVSGLRAGGDDYLVKPFALDELLARVEALCRRTYGNKHNCLKFADLEIDIAAKKVLRANQEVKLKPREYQLLEYLAHRHGEVVSQTEIEAHIYNEDVETSSNVVESALSSLRRKLSRVNPVPLIHTRRGHGYILEAENQ